MLPFSSSANRRRPRYDSAPQLLWFCVGMIAASCVVALLLYSRLLSGSGSTGDGNGHIAVPSVNATVASTSATTTLPLPTTTTSDESPPSDDDAMDVLERVYSASERRALAARYLFIRGYAKSGTSWSKLLIDLHDDVFLFPNELQLGLIDDGVARAVSSPWQASFEPYRSVVLHWAEQLVFRVMEVARVLEPAALYVGEKSPKAVAPIVDGARYVYVVRDGRDVLVSLMAHRVRIGGFTDWCPGDRMFASAEALSAATLRDWSFFERQPHELLAHEPCVRHLVQHWTHRVSADLAALAAHNASLFLILPYEQLARDPEAERRRVYTWLGLDPARSKPLGLYTMPLAGLPPDSEYRPHNLFFRKGEPGDWRNFFTGDVKRLFKSVPGAQALLKQLGHVDDDTW